MSRTPGNGPNSRIGTPIRAITSTISGRSGSSIPPASQAYEPLVKALFRHRLRFILLLSAGGSWLVNSSWAWWQGGGSDKLGILGALTLPFTPWIIFLSVLSWMLVALPVSVLRKVFLTASRSGAASPKDIVKSACAQTSTRIASTTYLVSALAALVIHTLMVTSYEVEVHGDPKLTLFVKSKKHPHYLNGRLVFLIITQLAASSIFSLRGALTDRFVFPWSQTVNSKKTSIPITIVMSFAISTLLATFAVIAATVVFALARFSLPILYTIPFLPFFLRPFTSHFLKGSWTIFLPIQHYHLFARAWFLAFSTFVNWEMPDKLFCSVVSETTPVSALSATPNITLVSGIASTDKVFQYFAYSELRDLAMDPTGSASARRADLFGDQKSALNLWGFLVRESLLLLGNDYQTLLRRGKPEPVSAVPLAFKPVDSPTTALATPTPLLRQRIFKSEPESPGQAVWDALASDGPIAKALDVGADATHVPELFRSVERGVMSSPIAKETKKNVESAKGLGGRVKGSIAAYFQTAGAKYVPQPLREAGAKLSEWWNEKRTSKVVEASLPFWELDIAVVDVLSYLTSASLTEDRYGVVQRDIPRILEAMISYLAAVEQYQIEINALNKPDSTTKLSQKEQDERDAIMIEVQKAQTILGQTADGLKEGIGRISRTFGDKLQAFKFPPRIAQKLQLFLDYS